MTSREESKLQGASGSNSSSEPAGKCAPESQKGKSSGGVPSDAPEPYPGGPPK